jgi:DNA modification methylase
MNYKILQGNNIDILKSIEDNSIDACITDPPYGMGMEHWDGSVPTVEVWREVIRVLKPGAFCLSFCSPELYHRMATAVEEAGFKITDMIQWMVTTKMAKHNRLKPAHEPIVVAQKPFNGTIKDHFEKWGVGKINIEDARIPWDGKPPTGWIKGGSKRRTFGKSKTRSNKEIEGTEDANPKGRYPSNIIGHLDEPLHQKYFYAPRATRKEKGEYNDHPTVKPVSLMRYLVRVYSPIGGTVLDPFNGTGTTGIGALQESREYIGIELEPNYKDISEKRINDHCNTDITEKLFEYDK